MTNKRLLILGISLFALTFVLAACQSGQPTGKAIKIQYAACKDSDSGINYYSIGTVSYRGKGYQDRCIDQNTLTEYYCDGNAAISKTYLCSSGCKEGACISAANTVCVDEDWFGSIHDRLAAKGNCTIGASAYADYCKGDYIVDYYCSPLLQDPKSCDYVEYSCKAYGFDGCDDGACVKDQTMNPTMANLTG